MTEKTDKQRKSSGKPIWIVFAAFVAALLAVAVVFYLIGSGQQEDEVAASGADGNEDMEQADLPHPSLGDEDAPVTMVEYSDSQCPYCGEFAREVEPGLVEEYVESGTLRIEWRDFPYLGQESVNAALAARAAQEQDKFWEYHRLLYENQGGTNSGALSDGALVEYAREAGLNAEEFEEDFKSGRYDAAVSADFQEGQQQGITGTPTFIINGEALVGAQPAQVFEDAIESAAEEAGNG